MLSIALDAFEMLRHDSKMKKVISFLLYKETPELNIEMSNTVTHRLCIKWSLVACHSYSAVSFFKSQFRLKLQSITLDAINSLYIIVI